MKELLLKLVASDRKHPDIAERNSHRRSATGLQGHRQIIILTPDQLPGTFHPDQ